MAKREQDKVDRVEVFGVELHHIGSFDDETLDPLPWHIFVDPELHLVLEFGCQRIVALIDHAGAVPGTRCPRTWLALRAAINFSQSSMAL